MKKKLLTIIFVCPQKLIITIRHLYIRKAKEQQTYNTTLILCSILVSALFLKKRRKKLIYDIFENTGIPAV